jgi:UDP-glucuronate decarboxylase
MFEFLNNKNILITGASGVIGSNLARAIRSSSNCKIHLNFLRDISSEFQNEDFILQKFDITNSDLIKNTLPVYDFIFHCSGYGQPQKFCENPQKTFKLNTESVLNLLDHLKDGGKFIFISTSEIYSGSCETKENSLITINPENSRNSYILGKLFGENILKYCSRNIETKSIRVCLCYGEGFKKDDKRVLSEFIMKGIDDNHISLKDDGSAIRSYIHIDDCVRAIANISNFSKYDIYNLGGDEPTTIGDLAKIISEISGCSLSFGLSDEGIKDSPKDARVCISRYEEEFGTLNKISLKDGIKQLISWYENN